ncbi:MAG: hypothetical protein M1828_000219 [Chrysothrix sp. TS-e1954]|nr:MAG: hypothetical protein M1828_000219 [Chrysothrix sp. TS-e1954]
MSRPSSRSSKHSRTYSSDQSDSNRPPTDRPEIRISGPSSPHGKGKNRAVQGAQSEPFNPDHDPSDVRVLLQIQRHVQHKLVGENTLEQHNFAIEAFEIPLFRCHELVIQDYEVKSDSDQYIIKAIKYGGVQQGFQYKLQTLKLVDVQGWFNESEIDVPDASFCVASRLERAMLDCGYTPLPQPLPELSVARSNFNGQHRKSKHGWVELEYMVKGNRVVRTHFPMDHKLVAQREIKHLIAWECFKKVAGISDGRLGW